MESGVGRGLGFGLVGLGLLVFVCLFVGPSVVFWLMGFGFLGCSVTLAFGVL